MKLWKQLGLGLATGVLLVGAAAAQTKTLKIVPHSNLTVLDPIWTTAYITRNHGYMIYDTLFGMDEKGAVKPQMLEKHVVSADKKTYTFTLRDGLAFHDGKAVTADDAVSSVKRWAARDTMGQKLSTFVDKWEVVDGKTFKLNLKEPYGLVIDSLGKPSSNALFIMPKRVADTDPFKQIEDYTGSGPFVFKKDEFKPGDKIVYTKNTAYKPRAEPANGLSGGKKVLVDRVEWVVIKDPQTQLNALTAGEVDMIEAPAFEQIPTLRKNPAIEVVDVSPVNYMYVMRFNHLVAPFNNVKVRQAAMWAMNQEQFLRAQVGPENEGMFFPCASMYPCGSPLASNKGTQFMVKGDMAKAKQLLKESGYDGKPIVILRPTDLQSIHKIPLVATQLLRQAGFTVDLQTMDWQTLVGRRAKKDPADQGGWNIFLTAWTGADLLNPIASFPLGGQGEKGWAGWAADEQLEKLRDQYAREIDPVKQKEIADSVQMRAAEIGTHAILGEYKQPAAVRKGVKGTLKAHALAMWNISK
jgi:peptide/nickel transport system substrate-binding protein